MKPLPPHITRLVLLGAALVVLLTLLLGISSCGKKEPEHRPNVVLIVIDTLRADHLPSYGYEKDTAPFMTQLATQGVVFERVHSTSSWTAPATASIVTALNPIQHGVLTGFRVVEKMKKVSPDIVLNRIPEDVETVAEIFKAIGYTTWAVTDNVNICREEGFDQGFERFWNTSYKGAAAINYRIQENMEEMTTTGPYFLYIHYMDPHRPYHPHAPWFESTRDRLADTISAYDSEIRYLDGKIAELYDLLGWGENTLVVVTSDHGEEFLDHGSWDHGRHLHTEVLDVPLFFYSSADSFATGSWSEHVSVLDVVPTLREYLGLPTSNQDAGVSLLSALQGQGPPPVERTFFGDLHSPFWLGGMVHKSVIAEDHKYMLTMPEEEKLFDLVNDPLERTDILDENEAQAEDLRQRLIAYQDSCTIFSAEVIEAQLTDKEIEHLKTLGYVD